MPDEPTPPQHGTPALTEEQEARLDDFATHAQRDEPLQIPGWGHDQLLRDLRVLLTSYRTASKRAEEVEERLAELEEAVEDARQFGLLAPDDPAPAFGALVERMARALSTPPPPTTEDAG